MKRKKPADPPLDWLRRSVWAGENPPDELDAIEAMAEELEEADKPPPRPRRQPGKKR